MGKGSIRIFILLGILIISSSCENRMQNFFVSYSPRHKISKALKQTIASEDSIYTLDLQSLYEDKIDSIFYFNGLLFSSEIAEITGLPQKERGATSTLLDTQSRIILFSTGRVLHYETFSIYFCFMNPQKTACARCDTNVDIVKYSDRELKLDPH